MNESKFNVSDSGEWLVGSINDLEIIQLKEQVVLLKAQVEALTPKPTVMSRWANLYDTSQFYGGWHCSFVQAQNSCDELKSFLGCIRKDTITHPDGRVEYKLEVEK